MQPSNPPPNSAAAEPAAAHENDIARIAGLDRERAERDRRLQRGYDDDPTAPAYSAFLEARLREVTATLAEIEALRLAVPAISLPQAQQTIAAFCALIDRDFMRRDWVDLDADLSAFVNEIRGLIERK